MESALEQSPRRGSARGVCVLLVGTLPGPAEQDVLDHFDVVRVAGLDPPPPDVLARDADIRGMAVGMMAYHGPSVRVSEEYMRRFPALEIVANFGVGYEHIDALAAARLGIVVTHTPNVLTEEVADTAIGLLLSTVRTMPQADRYVRSGAWLKDHYHLSASLRGRKLGMLGMGRIGQAVARRAAAFGLEIAYHARSRKPDLPYRYFGSVPEMAKEVDILMITAPGGPATRHLVDAEVLSALGPEGVVINMGRGSIVDEEALIAALQNGTILTAGLDVFADEPHVRPEFLAMDHIVLFPHIGSGSRHARYGMAQLAADNLKSWFAGKGPLTPVPETPFPKP